MWEWISEQTAWMYWTVPTGLAIGGLFFALFCMTVWDVVSPSIPRKGFYPIITRRGDRFFIGIMSAIFIFLVWLGIAGGSMLLIPTFLAVAWGLIQGRWG
ncbi:DUF2160 domain-containing protein [Desulfobaculum bizertense]|uniref:Predicted small integral membrane protein n=1 Tax=Desulfobaculum bizertense DSM 18034 TaxID=1121442 RepID=A0A1T4VHA8_9BACT|nr:DUF2160 family membrane protein [Desulfobaculum bizertense]UIJ37835.1 DUF2160 domain-containing protein [Desulfobaculum bizertense]SKA64303.1 Predicted small integral membrane protein [Desulfobaculum bizertense DSM 18034]